jgi:hypothetical protein
MVGYQKSYEGLKKRRKKKKKRRCDQTQYQDESAVWIERQVIMQYYSQKKVLMQCCGACELTGERPSSTTLARKLRHIPVALSHKENTNRFDHAYVSQRV